VERHDRTGSYLPASSVELLKKQLSWHCTSCGLGLPLSYFSMALCIFAFGISLG